MSAHIRSLTKWVILLVWNILLLEWMNAVLVPHATSKFVMPTDLRIVAAPPLHSADHTLLRETKREIGAQIPTHTTPTVTIVLRVRIPMALATATLGTTLLSTTTCLILFVPHSFQISKAEGCIACRLPTSIAGFLMAEEYVAHNHL